MNWSPDQPVNERVMTALPALGEQVAARTVPAPPKAVAVCLDRLLAFIDRYGLLREGGGKARTREELEAAMEGLGRDYRDALRHLPIDLLERSVATTIQTYRNGYRPPLPAEVAAIAEAEFLKRVEMQSRVRMALAVSGPRSTEQGKLQ